MRIQIQFTLFLHNRIVDIVADKCGFIYLCCTRGSNFHTAICRCCTSGDSDTGSCAQIASDRKGSFQIYIVGITVDRIPTDHTISVDCERTCRFVIPAVHDIYAAALFQSRVSGNRSAIHNKCSIAGYLHTAASCVNTAISADCTVIHSKGSLSNEHTTATGKSLYLHIFIIDSHDVIGDGTSVHCKTTVAEHIYTTATIFDGISGDLAAVHNKGAVRHNNATAVFNRISGNFTAFQL